MIDTADAAPDRKGAHKCQVLLRGMARTAVVVGTATAVSNRVSRRQAQTLVRQEGYGRTRTTARPLPRPRRRPRWRRDRIASAQGLGDLKAQGVLTDAEFEAEKARILG